MPLHPKSQTSQQLGLQRRKRVTIVAGFKCPSGVVMCADTEESAGVDLKWSTTKLFAYDREWCQAGFGGSVFGPIGEMLIERLKEELDKGYDSLPRIRSAIRSILRDAYENEIKLLPYDDRDKIVDLLIALRPRGQQDITLLKTHGTIDNEVHSYEVIGTGEAVRYVAENLYRNDLPIGQAVLLGTHLVRVAKKYAQGVGGDTHILILTSDGRMAFERIEFSRKQEEFFEQFNDALKDLTLSSPDTGLTNDQIFEKLEVFVERFIELRKNYFRNVMNESLRQALSGRGQGDVYSRFPPGQTAEQGAAKPLFMEVQLSPGRTTCESAH